LQIVVVVGVVQCVLWGTWM